MAALRTHTLARIANRPDRLLRKDMPAVPELDYDGTTMQHLSKWKSDEDRQVKTIIEQANDGPLSSYQHGILEAFLAGAPRSKQRLKSAGLAECEHCVCGALVEDMQHILFSCPLNENTGGSQNGRKSQPSASICLPAGCPAASCLPARPWTSGNQA